MGGTAAAVQLLINRLSYENNFDLYPQQIICKRIGGGGKIRSNKIRCPVASFVQDSYIHIYCAIEKVLSLL